jgi:CRISPR/Cas system-associated exonuclease Cas4 (RecB family)
LVADNTDLCHWWRNYLEDGPADLPPSRHPEVLLSGQVGGYRLVAKYDLIAVAPSSKISSGTGQRAAIVDWKTSRKHPRRRWLAERLQTRTYPYLLVQAGSYLNDGRPFEPSQVEMVYWFANFPRSPERFSYDDAQHQADEAYLTSLIAQIRDLEGGDFPLTIHEPRCRFCSYRSLCRRGVKAGAFDETEEELELGDALDISLDFEQIAEIEYG